MGYLNRYLQKILLVALLWNIPSLMYGATVSHKINATSPQEGIVTISLNPAPNERIVASSVLINRAHPRVSIEKADASLPSKPLFDEHSKQTIEGYDQPVEWTIAYRLSEQNELPTSPEALSFSYLTTGTGAPTNYLVELPQTATAQTSESTYTPTAPTMPKQISTEHLWGLRSHLKQAAINGYHHTVTFLQKAKVSASGLVEKTQSLPLRLLFVFLLGLLMSLTPCIYPMIPITLGILQTSSQQSVWRNFILAFSYTCGIATTFALLGLVAAYGGAQFGSLLGNLWFVLILVLFFMYFGLSMFDLYEIRIPSFLKPKNASVKGGSFVSAFIFGAISGTVASPCVSPGLLLLLGIVAALKNAFLGFAYLFLFGCGLGTPLLILGTFSNSLSHAPRAGMWMIEIKKIFGVLLLGLCLSYLSPFISSTVFYALLASMCIILATYLFTKSDSFASSGVRWYRFFFNTLLLVVGFCSIFYAIKSSYTKTNIGIGKHVWIGEYKNAHDAALEVKKPLLVKFGAAWCSSCNTLSKRFDSDFNDRLGQYVVLASVDCTSPTPENTELQKRFEIKAFPAVLILDPATQNVLARFSSEMNSWSDDEIVQKIKQFAKQ
ncbi:MAG: Thiol:disulfide interchange protein [candidate division TM6 bacterium GW2011_GWE2_41_16]|nr:MAG: Thiol:disulfide interchange protein [candidate division TM6 bacterium GW2011_GWE2_41_16]